MRDLGKVSDTSYTPIVSIGTPNESNFSETSAPMDTLSEYLKNDFVIIEEAYIEIPLVSVEYHLPIR